MIVFKHTEARFADTLVRDGDVHISDQSLFPEADDAIGDPDEGLERVRFDEPQRVHPTKKSWILEGDPRMSVGYENCEFVRQLSRMLFCTSTSAERSIDPKYDACVEISDAEAFFSAVTAEFARLDPWVKFLGWGPVEYRDRSVSYAEHGDGIRRYGNNEVAPFMRKDPLPKYMVQKEVRGGWALSPEGVRELPKKFVTLKVPAVIPLLRRVF